MKKKNHKIPVAILGSGNIGSDLLIKILRSPHLTCTLFVGKNPDSPGLARAAALGIPVSSESIQGIIANEKKYDIVFDATSAEAHKVHAVVLKRLKKFTIDMTPSRVGMMCVPVLNVDRAIRQPNVSMISCGGQATAPLVHAILDVHPDTQYVELISSIASKSAGIGTRDNIDEYTETTCDALIELGTAPKAKAIVILNPAEPPIMMHNTVYATILNPKIEKLKKKIEEMEKKIQQYVPGYHITVGPIVENGRVTVMNEVTGQGDFLPVYAGNLDIINCAAVAVAEKWAFNKKSKVESRKSKVESRKPKVEMRGER